MKRFKVTLTETVTWTYEVPAETEEQAIMKAQEGNEELLDRDSSNHKSEASEIEE